MLKEKKVHVFDTEVIKSQMFITYAYTQAGDEGTIELGVRRNGIVYGVNEEFINVVGYTGEKFKIKLDDLLNDKVKILGIAKSVESGVVIR